METINTIIQTAIKAAFPHWEIDRIDTEEMKRGGLYLEIQPQIPPQGIDAAGHQSFLLPRHVKHRGVKW